MTSKKTTSSRSSKKKEQEKLLRSLRSLSTWLTLGAWLSVLAGLFLIWTMLVDGFEPLVIAEVLISFLYAGALFWCIRLLDHRNQLVFQVFASVVVIDWSVALILRLVTSGQRFGPLDLAAFIVPSIILFYMYQLKSKQILT